MRIAFTKERPPTARAGGPLPLDAGRDEAASRLRVRAQGEPDAL